ncbi:MAG: cytochrome c peroxidase [Bacteroidota bacterium]
MKKLTFRILGIVILLSSTAALSRKNPLKSPDHFPPPIYSFTNNPVSKEKIELGRLLFYDPILSANQQISCASCHSPYNAFAHTDHDLSHGIHDQIGTRNAPALFNLAWQKAFMWDGAINHLDMQALAPITHPGEMGEDFAEVVQKLQRSKQYPGRFAEAFGDSLIKGADVLKALSQFQLSLVSANAKYDSVKRGESSFTVQEEAGYALFLQHCNVCHTEPLFSSYDFKNNGLVVDSSLLDYGKLNQSGQAADSLLFKTPSLRNLSFTYPYMHDGRFRKLKEVIRHYTEEIQASPTLSKELQTGMSLSAREKVDLIAFLLTLNDRHFVFHPDHQYPR